MTEHYATIARPGEATIEVKRSRFLAVARRAETEAEARASIDEARKEHWDARHHCSAFVLGPEAQLARSNDDGEPSGTAGAPILRAVQGRELSDVVVVVTRWFGGVLLGAGGLARAYGDAAAAALDAAGVLQRNLLQRAEIQVPVAQAARLEHTLRAKGYAVTGTDYGDGSRAVVSLAVPVSLVETLGALVEAETHGVAALALNGQSWVDQMSQ